MIRDSGLLFWATLYITISDSCGTGKLFVFKLVGVLPFPVLQLHFRPFPLPLPCPFYRLSSVFPFSTPTLPSPKTSYGVWERSKLPQRGPGEVLAINAFCAAITT